MTLVTLERVLPLAHLAPISLADLVASADLQTRIDRKYVVPVSELGPLVAALPAETRALEINGERTFRYRSVYYDTRELVSYRAAAQPRRHRFKIRVRSYLDSDQHFVEVKTRGRRGATVKARLPHTGSAYELGASGPHVQDLLDDSGVRIQTARLSAVLTGSYRRTTLYLPGADSRATIDLDLSWAAPGGRSVGAPGVAVVETKSTRSAGLVDRLLWSLGHRPSRISKYGTGLSLLRPELPANRWHRVRSRHLTPLTSNPPLTSIPGA